MIKRLKPVFLAPVIKNGKIPDLKGVAAISLRNAGDSTVSLDNGSWTLDSKETLSLNVTEDGATMDILDITVTFSGGSTNSLQIIILREADC